MKENIQKAIQFATEAHSGQARKNSGLPYIFHPLAVAELLIDHSNPSDEMIIAAILHDVVEDCGVTYDEIEHRFGPVVTQHVRDLTNDKSVKGTRAKRKAADIARLATINANSQTIKYCDIYHNSKAIEDFDDPPFEKMYLNENRAKLEAMDKGDPVVRQMALDLVENKLKRYA
jgi:(p)ppGpp synthase/HD superfamily hydrolase